MMRKLLFITCLFMATCITANADEIPNDEIWYTSSDGNIVTPRNTNFFGATILSNTYSNGKGIIKFSGNVTAIAHSFKDCSSLTSITIPNSVTGIGYSAFEDCSGLTLVTIPNSVTRIGANAFEGCSNLVYVTIPNSVTSIGDYAFKGCSRLLYVTIPNSVTSISTNTFSFCSGLLSVIIPNSVKSIGDNAFCGCSSLTSITIPNSVTIIGDYAFSSCSSLTSINIPDSVTSIGWNAFWNCSGLTSITIPNSVKSIGEGAFKSCSSLESIIVSKDNPYFSDYGSNVIVNDSTHELITGCKNSIVPNSVTSIGEYAFSSCSSLTSITIPNSVTSIGGSAFSGCSGLTSITIPNSVTSIGEDAFHWCSGLTSITIPNSVTSIGEDAFSNCSGLTSVTIGNSVTSIGRDAFYGCNNVKELIYTYGLTRAFSLYLKNLTSVTLPNTITTIDAYAFSRCSNLQTLDIPKSVTSIGAYAFINMSSLKTMYVHWDEPLTVPSNILIDASTSKATLYIPSSAVDAYKAADVWKDFGTIEYFYNFLSIDKNGNEINKMVKAYDDITLRDSYKSLTITQDISNVNVTYKRTFSSSNWQCWYVPFDLELTNSILNDFSFAEVEGAVFQEDGTPYIAFVKLGLGDVVKANTPYVIKAKYPDSSSEQSISADGVTLKKTADNGFSVYSSRHQYAFSGFYTQKTKGSGESWYAINNSGSFQQPAEGVVINPFRFSMAITNRSDSPYPAKALPSEVKIRVVGEDGATTSQLGVRSEELGVGVRSVNLAGQQVGKDFKGIVIKNGKKYLNR